MTILIASLVAALLALVWGIVAAGSRRSLKLSRIERKLDALLEHAGAADRVYPRPSESVAHLIRTSSKADAIRAYRQENPAIALKDAHDVVISIASPDSPRRVDLGRIERKIDVIIQERGIDAAVRVTISQEVRESVAAGDLIGAVRMLRSDNPLMSLTEARALAHSLR